jgi:hypothetical protein
MSESTRDGSSIRVEIKHSAAEVDSSLSEPIATGNARQRFPSVEVAREELATHPEVQIASAEHNPDWPDYYVVKGRPPKPEPGERGPAAAGWEFQARGNEVGEVAETLLTGVGRRPDPIVAYAVRDLGQPEDGLRFQQADHLSHFATLPEVADENTRWTPGEDSVVWKPDGVFAVYDTPAIREYQDETGGHFWPGGTLTRDRPERRTEAEERTLLRVYAVEIKHDSASFGRDQRAAMNALAEADDDRLVPLLARVTIEDLPQNYGVRIREGPFGDGQ